MLKTASLLKLVCFVLLAAGFYACNEDTITPTGRGSISGLVIDAETNEPIPAVSITTNPATAAVITDLDGQFIINNISRGNYTVNAQKLGYKAKSVMVAVPNNGQTEVTMVLEKTQSNGTPGQVSNPKPTLNATGLPIDVTLQWEAPEGINPDSVKYDVYLFQSGNAEPRKIADAISDTSVVAANLMYNTTYFWQVIARDSRGRVSQGEVWSFTTVALPEARFLFARYEEGNYNIYSSDGTAANTFRLTSAVSREWWPILNPQRDIIAYSSNIEEEPQIFTMQRDGSGKKQITSLPVAGYHNQGIGFSWSPDGGKLLYAHYDKLYTVNRDGSGLTLLATAPANRHFRTVDWTGSGDKIVAQTIGVNINDSEIYLMNADGTNRELLVANLPGRVESPSFSIDGRHILYTQDVSGFENLVGRQIDSHIFRTAVNGTGAVDLSREKPAGTNDLFPEYSPDGAKIIFVNTPNDGMGPYDIYIMNAADGSEREKLFSNATMPDWK